MEATGNENVDLNSQFGTIVATHPHLQFINQNFIPSPPPFAQFSGAPLPELREVLRVTYFWYKPLVFVVDVLIIRQNTGNSGPATKRSLLSLAHPVLVPWSVISNFSCFRLAYRSNYYLRHKLYTFCKKIFRLKEKKN